ncbi:MAG: sulfatase-like hydrolase/transferase, partial [Bacteroidetes bacterium]|nr:sulfatase-like hydrolase/transferase [Bacteroidota bacterium]
MKKIKILFSLLILCNLIITAQEKPNILLICVDDLRTNLGCYGDVQAITPHIDSFSEQAVTFLNHQVQYAVCGPSRATLTTGLMPEETGVIGFKPIRAILENVVFLPEHFKNNGYITAAAGKIHDPRTVGEKIKGSKKLKKGDDDLASWSINYNLPAGGVNAKGLSMRSEDLPDEQFIDGKIRLEGIQLMEQVSKQDKPFFLAIGFKKPHEPFVAPKKYWDLYDNTKFEVAKNQKAP